MSLQTRIILLTAARTYVGQHTLEIPAWCRDERLKELVAGGGATARHLATHMRFDRVQGTGLALPVISPAKPGTEAIIPDFNFADLAPLLREDGFIF
jgi:hypothetical protein